MKPVSRRCPWPQKPLDVAYHDTEWGVPLRENRALFELLILEGAQAGLSWSLVLAKRENYRRAFDDFDIAKIARYDSRKVVRLLANPGIVRNRLKIAAAIANARAVLAMERDGESFSGHLWSFVGDRPRVNRRRSMRDIPARTPESDAMSRDLKARGFKFVGSTICQAFMQAAGMVNDHLISCPRHAACAGLRQRRWRTRRTRRRFAPQAALVTESDRLSRCPSLFCLVRKYPKFSQVGLVRSGRRSTIFKR